MPVGRWGRTTGRTERGIRLQAWEEVAPSSWAWRRRTVAHIGQLVRSWLVERIVARTWRLGRTVARLSAGRTLVHKLERPVVHILEHKLKQLVGHIRENMMELRPCRILACTLVQPSWGVALGPS